MTKFDHILYYDFTHPIRNAQFEQILPDFCQKLTTLYVADDYPAQPTGEVFHRCDCLVTGVFDHYGQRLEANRQLKYIFMLATDVSDFASIDLVGRKITLENGAGYSTEAVAELSISVLMLLVRNLRMELGSIVRSSAPGYEIKGQHLGVIGAGRIGTAVGLRAAALGMQVSYTGKMNQMLDGVGARRLGLEELVSTSDALSLNLPLNQGTRGIFSSNLQKCIKPNATILCPSRPELFELGSLIQNAQEKGLKIWFDGVDDVALRNSLKESPANILISPSIAAGSINAQLRLIELAKQGLRAQVSRQ